MADTFKVGDVVRLKSGGPKMTVTQVGQTQFDDTPKVWCNWFEGAKVMKDVFAADAVELA